MKDSSVFPGSESFNTANNDRNSSEYDIKTDFKEFLEEAEKYAREKKQQQAIEEERGKKQVGSSEVKKGAKKKSWKTALLSFWKSSSTKKAKKQAKETPKLRGNVSGPIHDGVGGAATGHWHRLASSGPLTNLFHQRKRKGQEDDIPYVSLERLNKPEALNMMPKLMVLFTQFLN